MDSPEQLTMKLLFIWNFIFWNRTPYRIQQNNFLSKKRKFKNVLFIERNESTLSQLHKVIDGHKKIHTDLKQIKES